MNSLMMTVKKSHPQRESQCALMNCFQVRAFSRSGVGSMPASAPAKLIRGELDDQLADVVGLGWTSSPGLRAVVLPRGELAEPGQDGGRFDELAALPALLWRQQLARCGQATPPSGGEGGLLAASD
jgi:hypothetical protein